MANRKTYGLGEEKSRRAIIAPDLPYAPRDPKKYHPGIALIGCGGITTQHLTAYKSAGYNVVALCDIDPSRAEARQKEFFPDASVGSDAKAILRRDDVEVVDIATHPNERLGLIHLAIAAGKHVLSQKPFVLDLDRGQRLIELADKKGVRLAVNQNGRWAPHFSYIRHAVAGGLIGDVLGAHFSVHWNHDWVAGTPFEQLRHLVLYDFAIHWFDILSTIMAGRPAKRVYATTARASGQKATPPLLAQVAVEYDNAQASMAFDGFAQYGPEDKTYITATKGAIASTGPNLNRQRITLYTDDGAAQPVLKGSWFPTGFHGTMAELLCAIEENRNPGNSGQSTLDGLALCFAAVRSADTGRPQNPGSVRRLKK